MRRHKDKNGFSIYQMKNHPDIIRIKDKASHCMLSIDIGDVISEIDNITLNEWNITDLNNYLSVSVINTIVTQSYKNISNSI